jgi:hypothetical protein
MRKDRKRGWDSERQEKSEKGRETVPAHSPQPRGLNDGVTIPSDPAFKP